MMLTKAVWNKKLWYDNKIYTALARTRIYIQHIKDRIQKQRKMFTKLEEKMKHDSIRSLNFSQHHQTSHKRNNIPNTELPQVVQSKCTGSNADIFKKRGEERVNTLTFPPFGFFSSLSPPSEDAILFHPLFTFLNTMYFVILQQPSASVFFRR